MQTCEARESRPEVPIQSQRLRYYYPSAGDLETLNLQNSGAVNVYSKIQQHSFTARREALGLFLSKFLVPQIPQNLDLGTVFYLC